MHITSSKITPPQQGKTPLIATTTPSAPAEEPSDSTTFSITENKAFREVTANVVYAGGAAGGVGAGIYASNFFPSGMSGISGVITGVVMGALAGGGTGYGLAAASEAVWPSDKAGEAMTKGLGTIGGGIVGAVAGGISGYFGAQPLVVAPAAVTGSIATAAVLGVTRDAIIS